jgi:transcriptional regulator with XRE-family HTH domain
MNRRLTLLINYQVFLLGQVYFLKFCEFFFCYFVNRFAERLYVPRKITKIEIDPRRLRAAIAKSGKSNRLIAEVMGVSNVYLSRYLKDTWPSPAMFKKLVSAIGCQPSDIVPVRTMPAAPHRLLEIRVTPYGFTEVLLDGHREWTTDDPQVAQGDVQTVEIAVPPMVATYLVRLILIGLSE